MTESDDGSAVLRTNLAYLIYAQIAGVFGAFSLLAFLAHFITVDWHGALTILLGAWNDYVRPAVKWTLDTTVVAFLQSVFHLKLEIPLIWRDYFAVGFVLCFSWIRAMMWWRKRFAYLLNDVLHEGAKKIGKIVGGKINERFIARLAKPQVRPSDVVRYIGIIISNILFWPVVIIVELTFLLRGSRHIIALHKEYAKVRTIRSLVMLSPLIYLGMLLGANALLG